MLIKSQKGRAREFHTAPRLSRFFAEWSEDTFLAFDINLPLKQPPPMWTEPQHGLSNRPVFDMKIWNFSKIDQVSRQEKSVVGDGDGGDFQVHRANTNLRSRQFFKFRSAVLVEIDDWTRSEVVEQGMEFRITFGLLGR